MTHPTKAQVEELCQHENLDLLTYISAPDENYNHPFIPVAIVLHRILQDSRCGESIRNILKLHNIIWFDESYTYYFIEHESTEKQKFLMPRNWDGGTS